VFFNAENAENAENGRQWVKRKRRQREVAVWNSVRLKPRHAV